MLLSSPEGNMNTWSGCQVCCRSRNCLAACTKGVTALSGVVHGHIMSMRGALLLPVGRVARRLMSKVMCTGGPHFERLQRGRAGAYPGHAGVLRIKVCPAGLHIELV